MAIDDPVDRRRVKKLLSRGVDLLNIHLSRDSIQHLARYLQELVKWNRRINLIAKKTSVNDIIDKHFLDSLALVGFIERQGTEKNVLTDVGSGAGFPGLVVAVVQPNWQVRLVEPRQKRVIFLKHIVRLLQLDNVTIFEGRIEDEKKHPPGYSVYITGRAVAEPDIFLSMVQHLLVDSAEVILMTSTIVTSKRLGNSANSEYELFDHHTFKLPFSGSKRCLSLVGKKHTIQ